MRKLFNRARGRSAKASLALAAVLVAAVSGVAGATPTYDVTPVTTSITTELAANLPVVLGIVGALIALSLAIKAVRKFAHV